MQLSLAGYTLAGKIGVVHLLSTHQGGRGSKAHMLSYLCNVKKVRTGEREGVRICLK